MKTVVGVRFSQSGRIYDFDPGELSLQEGEQVIVETARGIEFADVVQSCHEVEEESIVAPLKPVLRLATDADRETRTRNRQKEKEAFHICEEKIRQFGLDMHLVNVEYAFDSSKILFYFTSDERVDFRELVKALAHQFKTRIELRQIGVRDEAKMLGGLGSCGRPVCCKSFLDDFRPISIKMAKDQNLSLSPTKISGLCGRLMCCLSYEQAAYSAMRKLMPPVNKEVFAPDGPGIVIENNAITEKTRVRITLPDGTPDIRTYHFSEVRRPQPGETFTLPQPDPDKAAAPVSARAIRAIRSPVARAMVRTAALKAAQEATEEETERVLAAEMAAMQTDQEDLPDEEESVTAESSIPAEPQQPRRNRGGRNRHRRPNPNGGAKAPEWQKAQAGSDQQGDGAPRKNNNYPRDNRRSGAPNGEGGQKPHPQGQQGQQGGSHHRRRPRHRHSGGNGGEQSAQTTPQN